MNQVMLPAATSSDFYDLSMSERWKPKRPMTMLELSSQAGSGQRNICFRYHQNWELNEHFNSLTVHP